MTNSNELGDLFKQAAEIAQQVPEALRETAFSRALDALLAPALPGTSTPTVRRPPGVPEVAPVIPQKGRAGQSASTTKLLEVLDRTEMAALLRGRKVLDRSLLLLQAAGHHDIGALTVSDIADVLTIKFREPTKPSAVRMALDRSPSYTDRRPNAGTFLYSLMASGEAYLDSLTSSALPSATKVSNRRRAGGAKSRPAKGAALRRPSPVRSKGRRPSERPGPKAALELLQAEGFFANARTMTDILSHLKESKTYVYKTSDMTATLQRAVRQGALTRSRNAEAQFQYKAN
jgi:hypothetical protein